MQRRIYILLQLVALLYYTSLNESTICDIDLSLTVTLSGHTATVESIAISPDSKTIVSGSFDNTIKTWDLVNGGTALKNFTGHSGWVNSVAISPDNKYILSGSFDQTIKKWDLVNGGAALTNFTGHSDIIDVVAISPDNEYLVSSSADQTIKTWDLANGVGFLNISSLSFPTPICITPDSKYLVSGSTDKIIRIYDLANGGAPLKKLTGHSNWITSLATSPDNKYLFSGSSDNLIKIWDLMNGGAALTTLIGHEATVTSIAISPDSKYIVPGSLDMTIKIWDLDINGKNSPLITLKGHKDNVNSVAISPDSRYIVSGSSDKTIKIWHTMDQSNSFQECWFKTWKIVILITLIGLVLLGLLGYTKGKVMYITYINYRSSWRNGREENQRLQRIRKQEDQIRALIALNGHGIDDTQLQIIGSIENHIQRTLPNVLVPFDKIKLDGGLIAEGGYARVIKGTLGYNTTIAIKMIKFKISENTNDIERLQREWSILHSLNHPNIIKFMGISFYEGSLLILQEYCPLHLGQFIKEKGVYININLFLDILLPVIDTIAFLHDKNIVHRDLKPQNILVNEERNQCKICDLGMAQVLEGDEFLWTYRTYDQTGALGTPGYMPPEILDLKIGDHFSPKAWDVFSMAMIIYFMWTGQNPLARETNKNPFAIIENIKCGIRPSLPPNMPRSLIRVVHRMWDQDYTKRPDMGSKGEEESVYTMLSTLYERRVVDEYDEINSTLSIPLLTEERRRQEQMEEV